MCIRDSIVPLQEGDLWGLMGPDGQWIAPPQFEAVGGPGQGRFPVRTAGKWGVVDLQGQIVVSFQMDNIGAIDRLTPMQSGGLWYAVGLDNVPQAQPLPFDTLVGNEGACFVGTSDGIAVSSWRGDTPLDQIMPDFESMGAPKGGYVPVQMGGKASLMDCAYGLSLIHI